MNRLYRIFAIMAAVALTARGGIFVNEITGMKESWYDLDVSRCVKKAQDVGIPAEYWVRESDGVKMFGPWVILAAHPSVTRYTRIQTSLGEGIVLDRHTCQDKNLIDIATTWKGSK